MGERGERWQVSNGWQGVGRRYSVRLRTVPLPRFLAQGNGGYGRLACLRWIRKWCCKSNGWQGLRWMITFHSYISPHLTFCGRYGGLDTLRCIRKLVCFSSVSARPRWRFDRTHILIFFVSFYTSLVWDNGKNNIILLEMVNGCRRVMENNPENPNTIQCVFTLFFHLSYFR